MTQIDDDPRGYYPVQDFARNSKTLQKIDWSNRLMAGLIRSGHLGGFRDRVSGMYFTSKKEILESILFRNRMEKMEYIDLKEAEKEIPEYPITYSKGKISAA